MRKSSKNTSTEFGAHNLPLEYVSKTYSAVTLLRTCRGNRHALDGRTYAWLLHATNKIDKRCDQRKTNPCAVCQAMPRKVRTEFSKQITDALAMMGAQNNIGRMHTSDEVAAAVCMLLRDRPEGCIYDLDREPAAFLE